MSAIVKQFFFLQKKKVVNQTEIAIKKTNKAPTFGFSSPNTRMIRLNC